MSSKNNESNEDRTSLEPSLLADASAISFKNDLSASDLGLDGDASAISSANLKFKIVNMLKYFGKCGK